MASTEDRRPIKRDRADDVFITDAVTEKGFVGLLIQSIFEPGANSAVVLAMNVSFFLLIIVLFGLAFLTSWDFHVLMMLGVSSVLWASMIWFVFELEKTANRPDNMPPTQLDTQTAHVEEVDETIAKSIPETRKDR